MNLKEFVLFLLIYDLWCMKFFQNNILMFRNYMDFQPFSPPLKINIMYHIYNGNFKCLKWKNKNKEIFSDKEEFESTIFICITYPARA